MSDIKTNIWKAKYQQPGENTFEDTLKRVAYYISSAEKEDRVKWYRTFFSYMKENRFMPGGRILANAGTKIKNLSNCFVLKVRDSRQSIFQAMKDAADIYAWGGGIGYNFSYLREKGAPISIGGRSSGVISFMKLFNEVADVIKIRSRRGATMGQLNISHPEILDFIWLKSNLDRNLEDILQTAKKLGLDEVEKFRNYLQSKQFVHFNISVRLSDDFMNKVKKDENFDLVSPYDGQIKKTLPAKMLMWEISKSAWKSGDPGVVFIDRINQDELMEPVWGPPEGSNPCSELYLYPYESCNLGSINLNAHLSKSLYGYEINWRKLFNTVYVLTRFLDNVVTLDRNIVKKVDEVRSYLRRIGIGIMGWADILLKLGIPYGGDESLELARKLMWFISTVSIISSHELAKEKGPAPFWEENRGKLNSHFIWKLWSERSNFGEDTQLLSILENIYKFEFPIPDKGLSLYSVRNVSWTSIAPTGSIAILAEASHSIEPFYKLVYRRNLELGGDKVQKVVYIKVPVVEEKLREIGLDERDIERFYSEYTEGGIDNVTVLEDNLKELFVDSHSLSPKKHVDMQAALQEFTSNSISKTVNMPNNSTVEDIMNIFVYMWEKGVKSSTIYRDGSKYNQVLQ